MRPTLVVDSSALVALATNEPPVSRAVRRRLRGHIRHAPHLVDAEVGNVLRRMVLRDELDPMAAQRSRRLAARTVTRRHSHEGPIGDRAWQLRPNVSFYDGVYVALAEELGCPLVTVDRRLAEAPGVRCPVEVI